MNCRTLTSAPRSLVSITGCVSVNPPDTNANVYLGTLVKIARWKIVNNDTATCSIAVEWLNVFKASCSHRFFFFEIYTITRINLDPINGAGCACKPEFAGEYPNCKSMSLCANNPCKNGGLCNIVNGNINCSCSPGFSGKFCTNTRSRE